MTIFTRRFDKPIIRTIWYYIYKKRKNCIIAITGPVGEGKSLTGVKIGYEFDPRFKLEDSLVYSVPNLIQKSLSLVKIKNKWLIKQIDLDYFTKIPDIYAWLMENVETMRIKRGKIIIFDETGAGAYVREFLKLENRTMGKLIQLWRILGIVCIVVVPEDVKLMDSVITRFLNIELLMKSANPDKKEAIGIAWAYRGWNKKKNEPIRHRLRGCRWGGKIHIRMLSQQRIDEYEKLSKVYKIGSIIHMALEQKVNKPLEVGSSKSIWDDIQYVKKHPKEFQNEKGKVTAAMIQSKLGVSYHKAQQIRSHVFNARA